MDIADALADALSDEGNDFSLEFTAARAYQALVELPEMKDLHVTVVPKGVAMVPADRSRVQHEVQVDIAVQKKLGPATDDEEEYDEQAELDGLMGLVEEIADFLKFRRLGSQPTAAWVKTDNDPIYSQDHLERLRQFTSVLTVTYRVVR
jgi:hypothetical protein